MQLLIAHHSEFFENRFTPGPVALDLFQSLMLLVFESLIKLLHWLLPLHTYLVAY